jgi:2-succinyl-5-enolpyruvyl-6-hydroxy-3-cyclohexene-1-carboxylate synthase
MLRSNLDYLATCLYEAGVHHWAVSPGSRNAPIIAGLVRHGGFHIHSFPDERSAAFAALGMAQATQYTCGVLCTSGTAVLNLYPGICEAYYQRIPVIALTADRPEELIDQWDGQTIHQKNVFEKHVLLSLETPQDLDAIDCSQAIQDLVFQAINTSMLPVKGPVHLNIPLRDPIYAEITTPFEHKKVPTFQLQSPSALPYSAQDIFTEISNQKILCLAGQLPPNPALKEVLTPFSETIPLISDITSNLCDIGIQQWEMAFQNHTEQQDLQPDVLITFGLSLLSKSLKLFIKKFHPKKHYHIAESGFVGDPFGTNPILIQANPVDFFRNFSAEKTPIDYKNKWLEFVAHKTEFPKLLKTPSEKNEFSFVQYLLLKSDKNTVLHLGNSMTVRYASWAGNTAAEIYCNRGTSGIDGTVSTAVGFALAQPLKKVFCVLGDISFFYDANALWTNHIPQNLGIVVLNNFGGHIFNFISGPSEAPELLPYIVTPHHRSAQHLASDYKIPYFLFHFNNNSIANTALKTHTPFIIEITHES